MKWIEYVGIAVIAIVLGIGLISFDPSITGFATQTSSTSWELPYCENYDETMLSSIGTISSCAFHLESFKREGQAQAPFPYTLDPLLLMSIASVESSCGKTSPTNMMQVTECGTGVLCDTVDQQINAGVDVYRGKLAAIQSTVDSQSLTISDEVLFALSLFAYNRGEGVARDALQRYVAQQATYAGPKDDFTDPSSLIYVAMKDACYAYYDITDRNGCERCRYTSDANGKKDKCVDPGLGAAYPAKVVDRYGKYCEAAQGELKKGQFDFTVAGTRRLGSFSFLPQFTVDAKFSSSVYDALQDFAQTTITECDGSTGTVEFCLNEQMESFNNTHMYYLTTNCEIGSQKLAHDLLEKMYDCANSKDDCVCQVDTIYNQEEIVNYGFDHLMGDFTAEEDPYLGGIRVVSTGGVDHHITDEANLALPEKFGFDVDSSGLEKFYIGTKGNFNDHGLFMMKHPTTDTFALMLGWGGPTSTISNFVLNKVSDVDGNRFDPPETNGLQNMCTINKTVFSVCAVTNEKLPYVDEVGKFSMEPIKIRFSLYLKDDTPPSALHNVAGTDTSSGFIQGNSLLREITLIWDKPSEEDVAYYHIYYDVAPFTSISSGSSFLSTEYSAPNRNGNERSYTFEVSREYTYFAIVAVDRQGNHISAVQAVEVPLSQGPTFP